MLDNDWHIERHAVTGIILERYQTAEIAAKNSKDECVLYSFTMSQEHDGSNYQKTPKRSGHNAVFIECNNIK